MWNLLVTLEIILSLFFIQISFAGIRPVLPDIEIVESRDLGITHTLSHDIVAAGDELVLVFSLLNHDQLAAHDIEIRLDLPKAMSIECFSPERGEFIAGEGIWKIHHLAGGSDVSLELMLLNSSQVDLSFSASIEKAVPYTDPIRQNNVTQGVIRVEDEDCLIFYNDYSNCSQGSSYLYIDCVKEYPNNVLYIYDRWGHLVFEQERYDNSWNGKRHPRYTQYGWDELPTGTYYYVLNFPKGERTDQSGCIYLSD